MNTEGKAIRYLGRFSVPVGTPPPDPGVNHIVISRGLPSHFETTRVSRVKITSITVVSMPSRWYTTD